MNNAANRNMYVCTAETFDQIKKHARMLTVFLQQTSFLTEAYILDYFVERLWTQLPSGWIEIISNFDVDDLEVFLNSEKSVKCSKPWPLSLLAFRASAFALSVSRKSIKSTEVIEKFLSENFRIRNGKSYNDSFSEKTDWSFSSNEFEIKSGQHKNIPEFCRRHVKPKKQHEIFRMAQLTDAVLKHFGLEHVIDIGSGQGHLSRLLALCYNLKVATVEADQCHVSGAVKFDKQAFVTLERSKSKSSNDKEKDSPADVQALPHHLEGSITISSSESYLEKVFNQAWCQENFDSNVEKFAILGLHTCGSLAETVLKTFISCDQAQVLLSIGCCYMKLDDRGGGEGYPLSKFVKSLPSHHLSYEAKEMACHAIELFRQRLKDKAPSLKIHCYRAALEKCIVQYYPNMKHLGLRGVKHAELLEFAEYAEKAVSKCSISLPTECFSSPDVQNCLEKWKQVLIFYCIRLITAPVVESLILLDRLLYLYEQGCPGCIAPIFDASLSPRNQILVASKCNFKNS